jgi:diadenylate cyclase
MILQFITVRLLDVLDIFLVAVLLYQLYRLIRGTVALNIFFGIVAFYFVWVVVNSLQMDLLSKILGQFIGVGVLALIIVFQQEIRRFLLLLGTRYISGKQRFSFNKLLRNDGEAASEAEVDALVSAVFSMAKTNTGALIVFSQQTDLMAYMQNGEAFEASINAHVIETIFYKNSPLHDGALLIVGNKIKAAKCVLPSSERSDLPVNYGMRHRSAIGMSEETNAIIIVVSEQSGNVSYCEKGVIHIVHSAKDLRKVLQHQIRKESV